jgi:hypothetical protein
VPFILILAFSLMFAGVRIRMTGEGLCGEFLGIKDPKL